MITDVLFAGVFDILNFVNAEEVCNPFEEV